MTKAFSKFHKLTICDGLETLTTRNYNTAFPFHFHPTYNISLVHDGTFRTKVRGRSLYAPSGSILITNPQEIHANPCESNEYVSFFTFYVNPDFFGHTTKDKPVFFQDNIIYDENLFSTLHQLADQIENGNVSGSLESELNHSLNELSSKYGFDASEESKPLISHSLFKEYLANEDFDKFSLEDTARKFGINKYKFLRLFKFQTGLTPNNYSILKRIEKSKELLLTGTDLLGIAIGLGFYDIPHFSKHFKKFTGISPSAYGSAIMPSERSA